MVHVEDPDTFKYLAYANQFDKLKNFTQRAMSKAHRVFSHVEDHPEVVQSAKELCAVLEKVAAVAEDTFSSPRARITYLLADTDVCANVQRVNSTTFQAMETTLASFTDTLFDECISRAKGLYEKGVLSCCSLFLVFFHSLSTTQHIPDHAEESIELTTPTFICASSENPTESVPNDNPQETESPKDNSDETFGFVFGQTAPMPPAAQPLSKPESSDETESPKDNPDETTLGVVFGQPVQMPNAAQPLSKSEFSDETESPKENPIPTSKGILIDDKFWQKLNAADAQRSSKLKLKKRSRSRSDSDSDCDRDSNPDKRAKL